MDSEIILLNKAFQTNLGKNNVYICIIINNNNLRICQIQCLLSTSDV